MIGRVLRHITKHDKRPRLNYQKRVAPYRVEDVTREAELVMSSRRARDPFHAHKLLETQTLEELTRRESRFIDVRARLIALLCRLEGSKP